MPWRRLHLASALVLALFLVLHLGNHLVALWGVAAHQAMMDVLRQVYRQPAVEAVLLLCVAVQMVSGVRMVAQGWAARRGRVAWLQAVSGLYLAFFLCVHVGAVLTGRAVRGVDTDFYFAAAGLHMPGWSWFFAPYYTLAVAALGAHLGCAAYWAWHVQRPVRAARCLALALFAGVGLGVLLVLLLAGCVVPVQVPASRLGLGLWP